MMIECNNDLENEIETFDNGLDTIKCENIEIIINNNNKIIMPKTEHKCNSVLICEDSKSIMKL